MDESPIQIALMNRGGSKDYDVVSMLEVIFNNLLKMKNVSSCIRSCTETLQVPAITENLAGALTDMQHEYFKPDYAD